MELKREQIVYVDGKPHIKAKVVILPFGDTRLLSNRKYLVLNKDKEIFNPYKNEYYHLYITSDEEIKEGDWCINLAHKLVVKPTDVEWANSNSDNLKKIVATTDESLEIEDECFGMCGMCNCQQYVLPQSSQQFIEKYIEEYNKGNIITDILVEVEPNYNQLGESIWELKLDSQNQITIRKQKDSWNREEVIEFCRNAYVLGTNNQQIFIDNLSSEIQKKETSFDRWVEENL